MTRLPFIVAALLFLCSMRTEAEPLLEPLEGIYWQDDPAPKGGIFSDSGQHQYEEDIGDLPDNHAFLPEAIPAVKDKPLIAIVIDDVGLDRKRSARAADLPAEVTLAFLPYSPDIWIQAKTAQAKGHQLIVHMPMEADRITADPGPDALETEISPLILRARILSNLSAFEGYAGVNNHMGSKFTRDRDGLRILMSELKNRGLFFLDSRTVPGSQGETIAREAGVPATHRDVFIDHYEDAAKVAYYLGQIEKVARRAGSVVAIGHPKDVTLEALEKWLPGLEEKGFRLATLGEVMELRKSRQKPAPAPTTVAEKGPAKAALPPAP